ncbi:Tubulin-specific chaperone [Pleurostoma richardsiae]|uniref:Tubulin-specific chaperone n=1 Tax=Pleurostoma richardsiae TaxID=41990 RepID=A0AA38VLN0_9PEZI|nr:Tubulin-specific chaperone [Pleurostoma richardsiae]
MATASFQVGQRLSYDGALCTVRYVGEVAGTSGTWLGVEWDDPSRGKHDGSHKSVRYFSCVSKAATAASFVRPTRPAQTPRTFLQALREKYASEVTADRVPIASATQVVISGKVAEEVGFDKVRRQLAELGELKIVILDGMRIAWATSTSGEEQPIREICPKVTELDLSRNVFTQFGTVVAICSELASLRGLRVNGNRFQKIIQDTGLERSQGAFEHVRDLSLDETLLEWREIFHVAAHFPSLATLFASTNQLSVLTVHPPQELASTLTSLNLEYNDFSSFSDIANLSSLTSLRHLHLKGNNISMITYTPSQQPPVFPSLHYLDISYNQVSEWGFIDSLPDSFPGLASLRFAHNPIYDNPALDSDDIATASSSSTGAGRTTVTEEAYMLTVARLASLKSLNFSTVTATDRTNAEMFYLSRIGRQLSSVPEGAEAEAKVVAQHRRYAELCELYGEPVVVRRREVNPAFLEARLINVSFHSRGGEARNGKQAATRVVQVPKSFDIYSVKGIAGRLFGHAPLRLRLVWETGEWDPVAGFDDETGDSSEDEDAEAEREKAGEEGDGASQTAGKAGRWVKREVELRDSPRQFGFCVDGLDVTIRVELT